MERCTGQGLITSKKHSLFWEENMGEKFDLTLSRIPTPCPATTTWNDSLYDYDSLYDSLYDSWDSLPAPGVVAADERHCPGFFSSCFSGSLTFHLFILLTAWLTTYYADILNPPLLFKPQECEN